ncbi:MAG: decaprenyl-phosphate phosphoribosyltransferase [Pseudomonadota bacterium]
MQAKNIFLDILYTIRPKHWVKNFFVFAPLFFSGNAGIVDVFIASLTIFFAFCLISSSVYILNDISDHDRDRAHPTKKNRPIAAGRLSVPAAAFIAVALAAAALFIAMRLNIWAAGVLLAYGVINIAYSTYLKHVVIVDVFCISLGFVLRVVGGGLAIAVTPSSWLITATFLLSLFLALAKRRHELVLLEGKSENHRPVLNDYSARLVDELISVVTPLTLISYLLYTLEPATIARFNAPNIYFTGGLVTFGIFRYLYLIHKQNLGGSPTDLVFQDVPLLVAIVSWVLSFGAIIYLR